MRYFSKLYEKYSGVLRGFKGVYLLNNLIHWRNLQHNRALYKKYGLRRSIYGTVGRHNFLRRNEQLPWLDQPDGLDALRSNEFYLNCDQHLQNQFESFVERGYMVLPAYFSSDQVDRLNCEIEELLKQRRTGFNYTGRKIMNAFRDSVFLDQAFFKNEGLLRILNFLMGKKIVPFQTINFIQGSEQRPHSDSIHMTTEPEGYLIAVWTALEDTDASNGSLIFYPGSHRLPYVSCEDYHSGNTRWTIGKNSYKKYEDYIENLLLQHSFPEKCFHAKKGDVFIWHANLLHGGSKIKKAGSTRRSMVAHYFCQGVICYHEISQRPALLESY